MQRHLDSTRVGRTTCVAPLLDRRIARIAAVEEARGVPRLPNDRDLLRALDLEVYYTRVYRLASDVVHYSIGSALDGFLELPDKTVGGGRVPLKHPDSERAEEALALAAITYGEYLERSEPGIRHGVTPVARRALDGYLKREDARRGRRRRVGAVTTS